MMFRKTPCNNDNIMRDDVKLKSYILGAYRDVLMRLDTHSIQRKVVMKRFNYLKDKPKYYWVSQIKIR